MVLMQLFNTLGFVFGPLMLLAGIAALALCFRASGRQESFQRRRQAVMGSFAPLVVGIAAAITGLIMFIPAGMNDELMRNLGKAVLAGVVVTALPLVWSLWLFRTPRSVS